MATELATAYVSLAVSGQGLRGDVNKALGGVVDDAGKRQGSRLGGALWGGVKKAGIVAGAGIAAAAGTAIFKGFGRLTGIENAEAKLRGLGHSAGTVESVMDNALASVKGTAFGLDEAATTAAGAVAAGIKPGKELERVLGLTGDAATIAGSSMGEMGGIFNKIASSNRVSMAEVNQLSDRGVPIMQMLADQYGVTAAEARKMVERGEVDFEAFSTAIEDNVAGAALESGNTTEGAFKNMGAALGRVGANLLGGIFPQLKGGFGGVTEMLDGMGPIAEKAGAAIGNAIQWAADKVGNFVTEFKNGEGAGGAFRDVMTQVKDVLMTAFDYVRDEAIPRLREMWEWVTDNKETVIAFGGVLLAGFAALKTFMFIKSVTVAVQAFSAALKANPIGLVITAIAALVAALVWLYNNNEDARRIMDAAWAKIKAGIDVVVTWFKNTAWPWMRDAFTWIGEKATWLWQNAIKPAFDKIMEISKSVFGWVRDTGWPWMRDALSSIGDAATTLYQKGIKPAWENISSAISSAWDTARGIFERFKGGLSSLRDAFGSAKDGIARVWSTIGAAIARPINTVIDTVNKFLEQLKDNLNKIPGVNLGGTWGRIPHVPVPAAQTSSASTAGYGSRTGPVMLADGSWVPGHSPHSRADNIPAMLTANEFVTRQQSALRMKRKHPGALEYINRHGELPGFAGGGRVGDGGKGTDDRNMLQRGWDWVTDVFKDATAWVRRLFDEIMPDMSGSWAGQAAMGVLGTLPAQVGAWIKEQIAALGGGGAGRSGVGLPWQAIWAMIQERAPEAVMTSNYRPGARTAGYGNLSMHGMGRAVDVVSGNMMATFRKLIGLLPWSELIFTPAGAMQMRNGQFYTEMNPRTRADHYDHIHAAYADGGRVRPFVADAGAMLAPGLNVLDNRTGGPEPLGRLDVPMELGDVTIEKLSRQMHRLASTVAVTTVADHATLTRRSMR